MNMSIYNDVFNLCNDKDVVSLILLYYYDDMLNVDLVESEKEFNIFLDDEVKGDKIYNLIPNGFSEDCRAYFKANSLNIQKKLCSYYLRKKYMNNYEEIVKCVWSNFEWEKDYGKNLNLFLSKILTRIPGENSKEQLKFIKHVIEKWMPRKKLNTNIQDVMSYLVNDGFEIELVRYFYDIIKYYTNIEPNLRIMLDIYNGRQESENFQKIENAPEEIEYDDKNDTFYIRIKGGFSKLTREQFKTHISYPIEILNKNDYINELLKSFRESKETARLRGYIPLIQNTSTNYNQLHRNIILPRSSFAYNIHIPFGINNIKLITCESRIP